ncbi:DUF6187 family protein [Actinomycetospora aeridis]|uniref:DUF6187 family protein n=1 Tax=Actinomycetospora aeridis TaxID=3129231 RepID=A0ABU8N8J2_9PSEU
MPDVARMSLPGEDAAPDEEAGVVVLGLDAEALLLGLGLAALRGDEGGDDDPALVATTVDLVRHGVPDAPGRDELLARGAACWSARRPDFAPATTAPAVGSVRAAWAALRDLPDATAPPAVRTYLVACWIRRADIDPLAARLDTRTI